MMVRISGIVSFTVTARIGLARPVQLQRSVTVSGGVR